MIVNRAAGLNAQSSRNIMATKHLLNERKCIKVPIKTKAMIKRKKRFLWNAEPLKRGHRKCKCLSARRCCFFVLFWVFSPLLVCAQTLTSQPGVDATNFTRLTTDVSIYFGSTSLHYNNTISCLFICNIIFQPCVFSPHRATRASR